MYIFYGVKILKEDFKNRFDDILTVCLLAGGQKTGAVCRVRAACLLGPTLAAERPPLSPHLLPLCTL